MNKNKKIAYKIIIKTLKVRKITMSTSIGSIPQWDSLAHLNIFLNLSKKFDFIDMKKASKVKSIKDWINLIK